MSKIKFFTKIVNFCKFLKGSNSRNIGFLEKNNLQDIRFIKNVVYPSYNESFMSLSEEQQKEEQEKKVIMNIEKILLPGETEEGYSWRVLENIAKIGMVDFSVRCCRDFFLLQKNEKISDDIKSYYPVFCNDTEVSCGNYDKVDDADYAEMIARLVLGSFTPSDYRKIIDHRFVPLFFIKIRKQECNNIFSGIIETLIDFVIMRYDRIILENANYFLDVGLSVADTLKREEKKIDFKNFNEDELEKIKKRLEERRKMYER